MNYKEKKQARSQQRNPTKEAQPTGMYLVYCSVNGHHISATIIRKAEFNGNHIALRVHRKTGNYELKNFTIKMLDKLEMVHVDSVIAEDATAVSPASAEAPWVFECSDCQKLFTMDTMLGCRFHPGIMETKKNQGHPFYTCCDKPHYSKACDTRHHKPK